MHKHIFRTPLSRHIPKHSPNQKRISPSPSFSPQPGSLLDHHRRQVHQHSLSNISQGSNGKSVKTLRSRHFQAQNKLSRRFNVNSTQGSPITKLRLNSDMPLQMPIKPSSPKLKFLQDLRPLLQRTQEIVQSVPEQNLLNQIIDALDKYENESDPQRSQKCRQCGCTCNSSKLKQENIPFPNTNIDFSDSLHQLQQDLNSLKPITNSAQYPIPPQEKNKTAQGTIQVEGIDKSGQKQPPTPQFALRQPGWDQCKRFPVIPSDDEFQEYSFSQASVIDCSRIQVDQLMSDIGRLRSGAKMARIQISDLYTDQVDLKISEGELQGSILKFLISYFEYLSPIIQAIVQVLPDHAFCVQKAFEGVAYLVDLALQRGGKEGDTDKSRQMSHIIWKQEQLIAMYKQKLSNLALNISQLY